MRGGARPRVAATSARLLAAFLTFAVLALSVLSLGEHGGQDHHASHAVECGLCLFAHADAPQAPATVAASPREAEAVVLAEAPRPADAPAPRARARGPPSA